LAPDAQALGIWLAAELDGWSSQAPRINILSGGSSAAVYRVEQGGRQVLLRAPQVPPRPDSLRALSREARLLRALAGTDVPHPAFLGYCEDEAVIGVPFLVTEFVEGWVGAGAPPPALAGRKDLGRDMAFSLVDSLARLHAVDYRPIGLEDFGRPEGFLERQAEQWTKLFAHHRADPAKPSRLLEDVGPVGEWLARNIPAERASALIHCDASFSNVMFCNDRPSVAALIDWEIATLGDPLLDLGRIAYPFPDARGLAGVSMMVDHGAGPTRQEIAEHYARRTGRSVAHLDYYMVLAMFKLAALLEPNYARHALGQDPSGFAGQVAGFVLDLLGGCRAIITIKN
jgi:aminoglycoside phosphotransferase (APT) family kinase protein